MKTLLAATVIMALGYSPLVAQNFEKGLEAYQAGDYAAAVQEWRPLAEQGNGIAQFKLGLMYRMGVGVQLDDSEAVKWYLLAAEQGNADAQNNLGFMYGKGEGVLQDYAKAVKWYRLAAEQGDADAQNNLAVMHYYGHGILQDYVIAHMWFNLASANGKKRASQWRDEAAVKITPVDISEAQKMAKKCVSSNYQNCGL